jgi:hypothetical protein
MCDARIIDWLRYQEITQLDERLARDARVERCASRMTGRAGGSHRAGRRRAARLCAHDAGA